MSTPAHPVAKPTRRTDLLWSCLRWFGITVAALWLLAALTLVAFRFVDPPTTAVHIERRLQAWVHGKPYHAQFHFVPLSQISPNLQHAVIAAEDARFYLHHGFDWDAMEIAAEGDLDGKRLRGGSTLTPQLVKNLFFGTGRSLLRKAAETTLVPIAELVLGKQRILELYPPPPEWGPAIYGADAASHAWDKTSARTLSRDQSAELAAILPLPLKRRPEHMAHYTAIILERMHQMGW